MDLFIGTLLLGISVGSVYALASTGLVLTYKTSGVLNLGYGSLALLTTFIHWQFTDWGVPVHLSAVVVVLLIAPLIGLFLDAQLFRRIEGQPQVISVIATVGLFVLIQGIVQLVWQGRTVSVPSPFPTGGVEIPGGIFLGTTQIGVFVVAAAAAGGLAALLRYTRLGVSFRAVVNNRPVAGLMGINTGMVSGMAWALGTAFAALTGILLTAFQSSQLDPLFLPSFVIAFVLGAAVVGYLRSLPLAYLGGILLGVGQSLIIQYKGESLWLERLKDGLPFLAITVALLFAPKALRLGGAGASFIVRTREQLREAPQRARLGVAGATFGTLALIPLLTGGSVSWQISMINGMAYAIVFLSLVILTGYSGQISLGHTAFMGIAAFTAGHIVIDLGWSVWLALPLGALAAVPAGALIGMIAARLHGLFLALITLAFAFMMYQLFFEDRGISGGEAGLPLPRPAGATGETPLYFLVLVVLIGCSLLAVNLRTGRTGRILAGMRDSETACRSLGIPVTRYKVMIFGLSAFMAGLGAVLQALINETASKGNFLPYFSLIFLTLAVLGGIFHVGGAIASGILFGLFPKLSEAWCSTLFWCTPTTGFLERIQLILFGLGATLALAQNPEGLFGELRRAGHALLGLGRRRPTTARAAPVTGGQE
jgi:branched-chain amino acid transport system permease protein